MIQVKTIADMDAYVSLLGYNITEGMILFYDLPLRGIRNISSLIKVGRQEPVTVSVSTATKGYINLSERCFSEDDIEACADRYNKSKLVQSITRHVAETTSIDVEDLYVILAGLCTASSPRASGVQGDSDGHGLWCPTS